MKNRTKTFIIAFCCPVFAVICLFPMFAQRIEPYVFGYPFNYFWMFAWMLLTSLCIFIGFRLDPYNKPEAMEAIEENIPRAIALLESQEGGDE